MEYQGKDDLLANKTILITGAGAGIGEEAALTYAKYGAKVILLGRTASKLEAVADKIALLFGYKPKVIVLDMLSATEQDYQNLSAQLVSEYGHLDGLLNNAGLLGQRLPMIEQDAAIWQDVMQVNINATFMLTKHLLPLLLAAKNASLILTSSGVGREGRKDWGAYSVSKFATEGMMQVLAVEYQDSGVRVNAINPGGTRTSMRANAFPSEDPNTLKTPADIMPVYLYLMGDDSLNINGQSLNAQS